jgi:alpha-tubulin suppressor-like RCC1 family protein
MKNRIWTVLCLILTLAIPASSEVRASEGIANSFNLVSAGLNYSCMVDSSNVLCWGDNSSGQLGDDTPAANHYTPVYVVEQAGSTIPLSGVVSVAAGWYHSCALMSTGTMKCWGYNYNGQLGDGTTVSRRAPVDVKDPIDPSGLLANVTAISTGWNYTCALISGGAIKCWGANGYGKLGNGNNTTDSHTPIDVNNLAGSAIAVAAGQVHTCAVLASGSVQCWGYNGFGQLGDGTYTNNPIPVTVSGLTGASAIATGFHHNCAVTTGGSLVCWGRNEFGQLGNNSIATSPLPVSVVDQFSMPLSNIETVSAGFSHSCARSLDGAAYCWGVNLLGQLGDGSYYTYRSVAEPVNELNFGYVALASGQHHSCAKNNSGGVKCWGYNVHGQLGNNSTASSNVPVCVSGYCVEPQLPPDQAIQNLIDDQIQFLIDAGSLNQGQGNALISKLQASLKKLGQGNTNAAINQLEAFINQMQALINQGALTYAEGQPLIDAANEIVITLGG